MSVPVSLGGLDQELIYWPTQQLVIWKTEMVYRRHRHMGK